METSLDQIKQLVTGYKSAGLQATAAIAKLKQDMPADSLKSVDAGSLVDVLSGIFGNLTPLALAQLLKEFSNDPTFVAVGVKHGFKDLAALQVGEILLDPTIFPNLASNDMLASLLAAGFAPADVAAAMAKLYPVNTTVVVQSTQAWQSTGITVGAVPVNIKYVGGQWTANPATGMVDSGGNDGLTAKPEYTMEGQNEGALIGRVGTNVFLVGLGAAVPANLNGLLELCINDDLTRKYGPGLTDNEGAVTVSITTT